MAMTASKPTLYDVRDIYCAAFAIAKGLKLENTYRDPNGWYIFQFDAVPMQDVMREWNSNTSTVNTREFIAAEKYLRGLMTSRGF
jgi:hypothetical protein